MLITFVPLRSSDVRFFSSRNADTSVARVRLRLSDVRFFSSRNSDMSVTCVPLRSSDVRFFRLAEISGFSQSHVLVANDLAAVH
jgi:hypothetical protein